MSANVLIAVIVFVPFLSFTIIALFNTAAKLDTIKICTEKQMYYSHKHHICLSKEMMEKELMKP